MTPVQRQTVTIEIVLTAAGDADPEASEIRVNGETAHVEQALAKSTWYRAFALNAETVLEGVACAYAKPDGWEAE